MKKYTASQLKQEISKVLNDVQTNGSVELVNRSRPDMVIITKEKLEEMLKDQFDYGWDLAHTGEM